MDQRLITPFIESANKIITEMTGITIDQVGAQEQEKPDQVSYGVASVITFAGKTKGRLIIDFEPELARAVIRNLLEDPDPSLKNPLKLGCISEMNNIIAGDANTVLNNQFGLGLRLAPPIVFSGNQMIVSTAKLDSVTVKCQTSFGGFKINIGFQGGVSL